MWQLVWYALQMQSKPTREDSGSLTVPSMHADMAGVRMEFSSAGKPSSCPNDVTSTDLPAPLSPVTTFNPGRSCTASFATKAKSLQPVRQFPSAEIVLCKQRACIRARKVLAASNFRWCRKEGSSTPDSKLGDVCSDLAWACMKCAWAPRRGGRSRLFMQRCRALLPL